MQVTLIRHGKPDLAALKWVAGHELTKWITRYNEAGIDPLLPPPSETIALVKRTSCIVTSDFRRAIASARILHPSGELITEPIFREAALPSPRSCPLRLPSQVWSVAMRIAWFLGWSPDVESFKMARHRAKDATLRLCQLAEQHGSVLLVGHTIFNRLLSCELRRAGWHGPRSPRGSYWGATTHKKELSDLSSQRKKLSFL